jgi:SAM-dependent methyltransferase
MKPLPISMLSPSLIFKNFNISMMNVWIKLLGTFKKKGLNITIQSVLNAVADWPYDSKYGIKTKGLVRLDDLEITSDNKTRNTGFRPTRVRPLKKLLNSLELPRDSVFVDLGCGKGRALVIAAEYGFKRVVGVEFSSVLCKEAKRNISTYLKNRGVDVDIEIVESDVCDYEIKDDENIFYLFDPFDDVVLGRVLKNLDLSIEKMKRKVWLIYNNPIFRTVIEKQGNFKKSGEIFIGNTEFVVYSRNS